MSLRKAFWSDEQRWSQFRSWAVPRLFQLLHSSLFSTLDITTSGVHRMTPSLDGLQKPAVLLVIWHDQTLVPLHLFRGSGITTLMSTSRNGRLFAGVWKLFGWPVVYGSTNKKAAVAALREMLGCLERGVPVGLTPDGPRGPRHQAHGGTVYLASKTGTQVLPVAYCASKAWNLPTWDKYVVPKPFARVHLHVGPPLHIPPKLSREETDEWQLKVGAALDEAERVARWELGNRAASAS